MRSVVTIHARYVQHRKTRQAIEEAHARRAPLQGADSVGNAVMDPEMCVGSNAAQLGRLPDWQEMVAKEGPPNSISSFDHAVALGFIQVPTAPLPEVISGIQSLDASTEDAFTPTEASTDDDLTPTEPDIEATAERRLEHNEGNGANAI